MNEQPDSDLQAELAAVRQRLSTLEAEHRNLLRRAAHTWRTAFSRKFLLSALPVALLLAAGGILYAVDALIIGKDGKVGIGVINPTHALQISDFAPGDRYIALTTQGGNQYRTGIKLWAWQQDFGFTIENDERENTNGLNILRHWADQGGNDPGKTALFINRWDGNVSIGTTSPQAKLDVSGTLNVTEKATLKDTLVNGSLTVNGKENSSFAGNVGIGTTTSTAKLDVAGDLKVTGKVTAPGMITGSVFTIMNNSSSTSLACNRWGTGQCQINNYCPGGQAVTIWKGYCSEYEVTSNGHCYSFLCVSN